MVEPTSSPAPAGRAKRSRRPPSKLDASSGDFSEAEMQRAIKASVKLQRRTNSVEVPRCPVFRPTPDEFADPFAYIKSITPEGQAAGIVKIIPPEGTWDGIPVVPPPPPPPPPTRREIRFASPRRASRESAFSRKRLLHENLRSLSLTRYLSSSPPETLSRLETGVRRHRGRRRHTVRDEAPDHQPAAGGSALLGRREVRPRLVQGDGGCVCGHVQNEAPRVCGARRRGAPRRAFGTSSDGKSQPGTWW